MSITWVALIIVLGGLVGGLLWLGLIAADRSAPISFRRLVVVMVAVGIACRIAFALFTPTFFAPDERAHLRYMAYLYEKRSLPVQTSQTDAPTNDWEYYQPPLYYLAATPIYALSQWLLHGDEDLTVRAIRLFSVALWCVTVMMAFKVLEHLQVVDVFVETFAVGMVCLLPSFTFLSSVINNDNLLIALGNVILYLLIKWKDARGSVWLGILVGLALWVKLTAVIYIVAAVTLFVARWITKSVSWSSAILQSVVTAAIASVLWSPWAARNLNLYGDLTAEKVANIPVQWPSWVGAVGTTLSYMLTSFWAASGKGNNVGCLPFGAGLTALAIIGLVYGLFSKNKPVYHFLTGTYADLAIASLVTVIANILLVVRFGWLYGQGQGRFLFPVLIPISVFIAVGLRLLEADRLNRAHVHAVGFLSAYALSFTGFSLGLFMLVR